MLVISCKYESSDGNHVLMCLMVVVSVAVAVMLMVFSLVSVVFSYAAPVNSSQYQGPKRCGIQGLFEVLYCSVAAQLPLNMLLML